MKKVLLLVGFFYTSALFANDYLKFDNKRIISNHKNPSYSIEANYPQIKEPLNNAEKKFNDAAEKWVDNKIEEFKKRAASTNNLPPSIKANGSTLLITYELTTIEPKQFVSVRYNFNPFYVGAAHPDHQFSSLNYDLIHNKALSLNNLFKHPSYLKHIAAIANHEVTAKLKRQNEQAKILLEGLKPIPENFAVWNITPEGMRFTFNESQVAAYVYGPQNITIPYQKLSRYFATNTVIANCLAPNNCDIKTVTP